METFANIIKISDQFSDSDLIAYPVNKNVARKLNENKNWKK